MALVGLLNYYLENKIDVKVDFDSILLSTVITREVFFCPDKIEFFYDNLVAW
jgi:hypothetical protein